PLRWQFFLGGATARAPRGLRPCSCGPAAHRCNRPPATGAETAGDISLIRRFPQRHLCNPAGPPQGFHQLLFASMLADGYFERPAILMAWTVQNNRTLFAQKPANLFSAGTRFEAYLDN